MVTHGNRGNAQAIRNVLIGETLTNENHDLALSLG
jgi:hypothetical protein